MQIESNAQLKPVISRYAALHALLGDEFGKRPLVLPTGEFFPDRFDRSAAGVGRLLERMQLHAAMGDIPVSIELDEGGPAATQSCGTGSCAPQTNAGQARLSMIHDTWTLRLSAAETAHPVGLTTLLSSALGMIFLEETRPDGASLPDPIGVTIELAAVGLGFGVLLLEGSYVYSKSCGGPNIAKLTQLGAGQLAPLVALFASQHGHSLRPALRNVSATQRALLGEAKDWIKANRTIAKAMALNPGSLSSGDYALNEASGSFFGLLGRKPTEEELLEEALLLQGGSAAPIHLPDADAERLGGNDPQDRNERPRPRDPASDDLKALVDSALAEMRQG
jgi:hypothetical protein